MNRFRYTLISICLLLLFLGASDLHLWWRNPAPLPVTVDALERAGAPREWLGASGGWLDLDRAISTSGTVEMEALLVPLLATPGQKRIDILVETRDPRLLKLFRDYHFLTDTLAEKQEFRSSRADEFMVQREVTGMLVAGLIARGNRDKLLKLARETGLEVADQVIFISEGKQPERWRGTFFALVGLLGLVRVLTLKKQADARGKA